MSEYQNRTFDWGLWFLWMMATTVGWLLGRFLLPNLSVVTIGLAIGILQAFVLREEVQQPLRWILATTIGWAVPGLLLLFANPIGTDFLNGLLVGVSMGVAQWLILRQEVRWAGWWIIMNIIAWTTGFALLPGILLTGVMAGLITATALGLLLMNRKPVNKNLVEY